MNHAHTECTLLLLLVSSRHTPNLLRSTGSWQGPVCKHSKTLHLSTNPRKQHLQRHWVLESAALESLGAQIVCSRATGRSKSLLLSLRNHCRLCCGHSESLLSSLRNHNRLSTVLTNRSSLQNHCTASNLLRNYYRLCPVLTTLFSLRNHCTASNSFCTALQAP